MLPESLWSHTFPLFVSIISISSLSNSAQLCSQKAFRKCFPLYYFSCSWKDFSACLICRPNFCLFLLFSSVAQSCAALCNPMDWSMPGFPVHHQLLELAQTHVHWVGDAIQPSHPLLSLLLPHSIFPSIRVFSNESVSSSHQVVKVLEFQLQHRPSNEYSRLISFMMDCLDLLSGQRTLKSLLQHHSSKASILWHSAFFIV